MYESNHHKALIYVTNICEYFKTRRKAGRRMQVDSLKHKTSK